MASEYEKKMVEMQFQLKENQQYLEDAFKDIECWSSDMKVKEEKIVKNESALKESKDNPLPPVRTLASTKKKKKIYKNSQKNTKESIQKIKAYDYRNWDKFDVDAACEEIDKKMSSSSSDYTTDEEWEEQQKKNRSNWEKERGNLYLKENMIDEAINCYTRAIELDPTNAIFPANRAMCLLKQEKFGAAEVDCTLSITLDPKYIKAYHRRGTARLGLKKYNEAKEDFTEVLKLEPFNKQAQQELIKIEKEVESLSLVFPIDKPIETRSKKPLKRIKIQEINTDIDENLEAARNEIKSKIKLNENDEKLFNLNETESKIFVEKPIEKEINLKKISEIETKKVEIKNIKTIPQAPTNGFQLRKDWQLLSNNLDDLSTYFKQISPESYPKLFMNGLESDILSKILNIFKNFIKIDNKFQIIPYMHYLSEIKRFQTQILFLTNEDKKNIEEIFDFIRKNASENDNFKINELEKKFKF